MERDKPPSILRLPKVVALTGISRSTIYRRVAQGEFPAQVQISERAVGWREEEVMEWVESRPTVSQRE